MAEGPSASRTKPEWFRIRRLATGPRASRVLNTIAANHLHTVCSSAACPNKGTCFEEGTATFLILGNVCTRACAFCNIGHGAPLPLDSDEPRRVAEAARLMNLSYVVVTSVTRDDLPDEGSKAFAATIRAIRKDLPNAGIEVLVPDFSGREDCLRTVLEARPDVFNHNLETVERITPDIRSKARYRRSLEVLASARRIAPEIPTKSGLMVGLGESRDDLGEAFKDLSSAGVGRLTIGQYLQPTRDHLPVVRFYTPSEFDELADEARSAGIPAVLSGPLVRSSYHAGSLSEEPAETGRASTPEPAR